MINTSEVREYAESLLRVTSAADRGKKMQKRRFASSDMWSDCLESITRWNPQAYEYRIKPKEPETIWVAGDRVLFRGKDPQHPTARKFVEEMP